MKRLLVGLAVLSGLLVGCRTHLSSIRPPPPAPVYVGDKSCMVQDFVSATEVPDGSKNLGWASVPETDDDEKTYISLRQKVCEMGGDAISQVAWVRETGEEKLVLKANVWSMP